MGYYLCKMRASTSQTFTCICFFFNPHYRYTTDYRQYSNIKYGVYDCLNRMVPNKEERTKVDLQLDIFAEAKGLFGIEATVIARDKKNSS